LPPAQPGNVMTPLVQKKFGEAAVIAGRVADIRTFH
jgi:hypothetical protein